MTLVTTPCMIFNRVHIDLDLKDYTVEKHVIGEFPYN